MAFKPLSYYCNSSLPLVEQVETEYGSYLQRMSHELKLATRAAFSALIMLVERSEKQLTMRVLAQQACGWVVPYIDVEDYQRLNSIMETAIHLTIPDLETFLYAVTSIIKHEEE